MCSLPFSYKCMILSIQSSFFLVILIKINSSLPPGTKTTCEHDGNWWPWDQWDNREWWGEQPPLMSRQSFGECRPSGAQCCAPSFQRKQTKTKPNKTNKTNYQGFLWNFPILKFGWNVKRSNKIRIWPTWGKSGGQTYEGKLERSQEQTAEDLWYHEI